MRNWNCCARIPICLCNDVVHCVIGSGIDWRELRGKFVRFYSLELTSIVQSYLWMCSRDKLDMFEKALSYILQFMLIPWSESLSHNKHVRCLGKKLENNKRCSNMNKLYVSMKITSETHLLNIDSTLRALWLVKIPCLIRIYNLKKLVLLFFGVKNLYFKANEEAKAVY